MKLPEFTFTLIDNWAVQSPKDDYVRMDDARYRLSLRATCKACGWMIHGNDSLISLSGDITRHTCGNARIVESKAAE